MQFEVQFLMSGRFFSLEEDNIVTNNFNILEMQTCEGFLNKIKHRL